MKPLQKIPRSAARLFFTVGLVLHLAEPAWAGLSDTAFCYQASLLSEGSPANGSYDLRLTLFDSATGGNPLGRVTTNANVAVVGGYFTTTIDLGVNALRPPGGWLEVAFCRSGSGGIFLVADPRHHLPNSADVLPGADDIADSAVTQLPGATEASPSQPRRGHLAAGPVPLDLPLAPAVVDCGTYTNCYWSLLGNGNLGAGVNFLGTVAGELDPLEFRVNDNRTMLYTFTGATTAPNITGGYFGNSVAGVGSIVAGGGRQNSVNQILTDYATIGGGHGNSIRSFSFESVIGGGSRNVISNSVLGGTISGGVNNLLLPNQYYPTIGGGSGNRILPGIVAGTIGGGAGNEVSGGGSHAMVGGGQSNTNQSPSGVIGGGIQNWVTGTTSVIGGGSRNWVPGSSSGIVGGSMNRVSGGDSLVGGGLTNVIELGASLGFVGGGASNVIWPGIVGGTIGGGAQNAIRLDAQYAAVVGGLQAQAGNFGQQAHASGRFSSNGDAQTGLYVVRNSTPTNTAGLVRDLFLDGVSRQIRVPFNSTWIFDIMVVGRDSGTGSAAYHFRGVIENNANVTALGPVAKTVVGEDLAALDANVLADNGTEALVVRVTGSPFTNYRWVATVRTTEVTY